MRSKTTLSKKTGHDRTLRKKNVGTRLYTQPEHNFVRSYTYSKYNSGLLFSMKIMVLSIFHVFLETFEMSRYYFLTRKKKQQSLKN